MKTKITRGFKTKITPRAPRRHIMPNGFAARVREAIAMEDKSGLVLKLQPGSKTGYLGVIEVKGKFQGRVQIKGDGRGGVVMVW